MLTKGLAILAISGVHSVCNPIRGWLHWINSVVTQWLECYL